MSIEKINEKVEKLENFVISLSKQMEVVFVPCPGTHTYYSTMLNDDICKICGKSEDSAGGDIRKEQPTNLAKRAKLLLAELEG